VSADVVGLHLGMGASAVDMGIAIARTAQRTGRGRSALRLGVRLTLVPGESPSVFPAEEGGREGNGSIGPVLAGVCATKVGPGLVEKCGIDAGSISTASLTGGLCMFFDSLCEVGGGGQVGHASVGTCGEGWPHH